MLTILLKDGRSLSAPGITLHEGAGKMFLDTIEHAGDARDRWIGQGRAGAAQIFDWYPLEVDGTKIFFRLSEVVAFTDQREQDDVTVELPSAAARSVVLERGPDGRVTGARPAGPRTTISGAPAVTP
jgi:hypothetical protein